MASAKAGGGGVFDVTSQLAFYGAYHSKLGNQLIHLVCVPLLAFTVFVWLAYTSPLVETPAGSVPAASAALLAAAGAYYVCLDAPVGALAAVFYAGVALAATAYKAARPAAAWQHALAGHALGWYLQIHPGHALIEGRRPALLDSLFQSLCMAPLFVLVEVAFWAGYKPALRDAVHAAAAKDIGNWRAAQAKKGR